MNSLCNLIENGYVISR